MKKIKETGKEKNQNLHNTIKTTKHIFGFVWKENYGKVYIFIKVIMSLLNALFPLVYTIIPGLIINELTNEQRINTLILYVGILIVTPVISHIINTSIGLLFSKLGMALNLKFTEVFYDHIANMDYESLENPDVQIVKSRAQSTLDGILGIIDQLNGLLSAIFSLIAISSIITTLNPIIIILIIVIIYINSLVTKKVNHKMYLIGKELSKYDRYQWGFTYMLEQFRYAKEIRLFNLKSFLIEIFVDNKTESNNIEFKQRKTGCTAGTFTSITNLLQQLALYIYLILSVIKRGLAVGSMTIYMTAVGQFAGALGMVFNSYLGLSNNSLKIQEMIDFMNIPLRQYETGNKIPIFDKDSIIEFKNVSFKYPGSDNYALKNMNIIIRGNEKLCIVGANGSGKSTFIKLLTRLYWLEEGEILLNGININEYDYLKYQRLFAPVFQDFVRYYFTLGKNIALANDYNQARLDEVCSKSGLTSLVNKLPKGYDTQVDKWIDEEGFEPSGGEDQRIAIARAVYNDGLIFLLDEPTAALDPLAEYEIYMQFNEMIADKCAVLITHRLSAVQLADKVAVFESGNLVEYGTHKQLYESGGIYNEMFNKQAQFYRTETL